MPVVMGHVFRLLTNLPEQAKNAQNLTLPNFQNARRLASVSVQTYGALLKMIYSGLMQVQIL